MSIFEVQRNARHHMGTGYRGRRRRGFRVSNEHEQSEIGEPPQLRCEALSKKHGKSWPHEFRRVDTLHFVEPPIALFACWWCGQEIGRHFADELSPDAPRPWILR